MKPQIELRIGNMYENVFAGLYIIIKIYSANSNDKFPKRHDIFNVSENKFYYNHGPYKYDKFLGNIFANKWTSWYYQDVLKEINIEER